jgi:hypothetical protein
LGVTQDLIDEVVGAVSPLKGEIVEEAAAKA